MVHPPDSVQMIASQEHHPNGALWLRTRQTFPFVRQLFKWGYDDKNELVLSTNIQVNFNHVVIALCTQVYFNTFLFCFVLYYTLLYFDLFHYNVFCCIVSYGIV